jgi:hypothetical protein
MKRDWRVARRLEPRPDGQRRWDRAYQLVLGWAAGGPPPTRPPGTVCAFHQGDQR